MYRLAVDATVIAHFTFILFVIFGSLLAWKWPWVKWVHLPAMAYGLLIEVFNWYCPLTLLEYELRRRAGLRTYEDSFITHQLRELIYLDASQAFLIAGAAVVILLNAAFYALIAKKQKEDSRGLLRET